MKYTLLVLAAAALVSANTYDDSAPPAPYQQPAPAPYQAPAPEPYQAPAPAPYQAPAPAPYQAPAPAPYQAPLPVPAPYSAPQQPAAYPTSYSETYKAQLPSYQHHDCDATSSVCYAPKSYGQGYNAGSYSYKRQYPYPGPKARFQAKLKKLKGFFKGIINKIRGKLCHTWINFKNHWNEYCAIVKSDLARFEDWKKCKKQKFKDWWGYHQDLCRTRKQLWDDAMREFHRQWCHYKKTRKEEYERKKKECGIKERDYDDDRDYQQGINNYGLSPVEDSYGAGKAYGYQPAQYKQHCHQRDQEYYKENPSARKENKY